MSRCRPTTRCTPLNAHKLMMPASTQKILTLAVAADQLGWDFTLSDQRVDARPGRRRRSEGRRRHGRHRAIQLFDDWDGAATTRFAEWAGALKRLGIQNDRRPNHRRRQRVRRRGARNRVGVGRPRRQLRDGRRRACSSTRTPRSWSSRRRRLEHRPTCRSRQKPHISPCSIARPLAPAHHCWFARFPTPRRSSSMARLRRLPRACFGMSPSLTRRLYFASAVRDGLIRGGIEVVGPAIDIDDLDDAARSIEGDDRRRECFQRARGHRQHDDENEPEPVCRDASQDDRGARVRSGIDGRGPRGRRFNACELGRCGGRRPRGRWIGTIALQPGHARCPGHDACVTSTRTNGCAIRSSGPCRGPASTARLGIA